MSDLCHSLSALSCDLNVIFGIRDLWFVVMRGVRTHDLYYRSCTNCIKRAAELMRYSASGIYNLLPTPSYSHPLSLLPPPLSFLFLPPSLFLCSLASRCQFASQSDCQAPVLDSKALTAKHTTQREEQRGEGQCQRPLSHVPATRTFTYSH